MQISVFYDRTGGTLTVWFGILVTNMGVKKPETK